MTIVLGVAIVPLQQDLAARDCSNDLLSLERRHNYVDNP